MPFARLCVIAAIVVVASQLPNAVRAAERPNILFIYADDMSCNTISCYEGAYSYARTPHIDKLAREGVRFHGAYLGSWCMPSRASMLTGRHPHGIESMRLEGQYPGSTYDPEQCRFWPAVFRQNGYQTAQIGKWHTGTDAGFGRDWDYQIVWNRPKHPENAGSYFGKQITYFNGEQRTVTGYSTDNYTDWACDYIRGENRDANKPWYLWLCYGAIHGPTTPADRHKGVFKGESTPVPADIFPPRPGKPSYLEKTQAWFLGPNGEPMMGKSSAAFGDDSAKNPRTLNQWVQQVNECMLAVDEGVGRLLEALADSGQLENTLVIFTADQGFANGEHGMRIKLAPYEMTYRSPMIARLPGVIPAGKVSELSVNAPDLVQTFFAFAGIELPWKMHGRDLSGVFKDPENTAWNYPTLYEHTGHEYGSDVMRALRKEGKLVPVHGAVPYYLGLRHGQFKYIRYLVQGNPEELYDLKADPEELHNLVSSSDHQSQLAELRELWLAEARRCDAPFLDILPEPSNP